MFQTRELNSTFKSPSECASRECTRLSLLTHGRVTLIHSVSQCVLSKPSLKTLFLFKLFIVLSPPTIAFFSLFLPSYCIIRAEEELKKRIKRVKRIKGVISWQGYFTRVSAFLKFQRSPLLYVAIFLAYREEKQTKSSPDYRKSRDNS